MEQRRALGRGIASLIPKRDAAQTAPNKDQPAVTSVPTPKSASKDAPPNPFREVAIGQIRPYANQPRKYFDEERIEELAQSIRQKGILQPLLVRTVEGGYELIAGERRWRAAKLAELTTVPVIVREVADREQLELALVENLQRADLDPIEEAQGFAELMERFTLTQEEVADHVGRSRSAVANSLRLLKLPDKVQEALRSGAVTVGHAKVLLGESIDTQLMLLEKLLKEDMPVRQLERLAKALGSRRSRAVPASQSAADAAAEPPVLTRITEELRKRLGTQVQIETTDKGGRIVIEYYSEEQLDDLYQRMTGYHLTRRKTRGI